MCEFRVVLRKPEGTEEVALDVVRAAYEDGGLVLIDITGRSRKVDGAIIVDVNVPKEQLELLGHPLLGRFLNIVFAHVRGADKETLRAMWEEFKRAGDDVFG